MSEVMSSNITTVGTAVVIGLRSLVCPCEGCAIVSKSSGGFGASRKRLEGVSASSSGAGMLSWKSRRSEGTEIESDAVRGSVLNGMLVKYV